MAEFGKLADEAKERQDAIAARENDEAQREKAARGVFVDAAVAMLNQHVNPLLEQAKIDFAARGVESKLVQYYDVKGRHSTVKPSLRFSCFSPPRKSDQYQMESKTAVFSSDGQTLFVSVASDRSTGKQEDLRSSPIDACETLVTEAVDLVITDYFKMVRTQISILR